MIPVVAKKFGMWFREFFGQVNPRALEGKEILLQHRLWKMSLEPLAQDYGQAVVQRNKPGIKGSVVKARKAQPVSGVQSLTRKVPPRFYVAGDQQGGTEIPVIQQRTP